MVKSDVRARRVARSAGPGRVRGAASVAWGWRRCGANFAQIEVVGPHALVMHVALVLTRAGEGRVHAVVPLPVRPVEAAALHRGRCRRRVVALPVALTMCSTTRLVIACDRVSGARVADPVRSRLAAIACLHRGRRWCRLAIVAPVAVRILCTCSLATRISVYIRIEHLDAVIRVLRRVLPERIAGGIERKAATVSNRSRCRGRLATWGPDASSLVLALHAVGVGRVVESDVRAWRVRRSTGPGRVVDTAMVAFTWCWCWRWVAISGPRAVVVIDALLRTEIRPDVGAVEEGLRVGTAGVVGHAATLRVGRRHCRWCSSRLRIAAVGVPEALVVAV